MLDIKKRPLSREEQALNHSIAAGRLMIRPRGNAHVFYAMNEHSKRRGNAFRVHIMEEEVG